MTDQKNPNISDLIAMYLAGEASDADKKFLEEQILNNAEAKALWEEMNARFQETRQAYKAIDRQATWQQIDLLTTPRKRSRPVYRKVLSIASAACIVLAIGTYAFWRFYSPAALPDSSIAQLTLATGEVIDLSQPKDSIAIPNGPVVSNNNRSLSYTANNTQGLNTLWSPAGSDYKILLSDGTEVWLNSMTTLRFPFQFTGKNREIFIDGEAFLNVAKNAEQPFIVHLPKGDVHVLGTTFNVNTYDQQSTSVALVTGSVKLQMADQSTVIKPGYQATMSKGKDLTAVQFDNKEVLGWMEGLHLFNNASLEEIVKVLHRWYGVKVVLDNPSSAQNRFTGYIDRKQPIEDFLKEIKATSDADYYYDDDRLLHFR
jgi:transmembrane sensor